MPKAIIAFLITLFLVACSSASGTDTPAETMDFVVTVQEGMPAGGTFTEKQVKVISNQDSLNQQSEIYGVDYFTVDFSTSKVLIVDMGQRNTGGFSVDVTSIEIHPESARANVVLTVPGADCIVTDALTNPFMFVEVSTRQEILVSESLEITDCSS
ncbi:MAG: protease complex subunit PrcB family protein [Granulosicoccus sp.]|nr:protease complex subunit PrcB family protein [Granulosicoccus sp.]